MASSSPQPNDKWHDGSGYERYMGRWSRQLAPRLLTWLAAPPGLRWLDVGCGTGALSAAIADGCEPAALTGIDPSEGFLAAARQRLPDCTVLHRAGADAMPLADGSVDVAVASLVLNFVPDGAAALREMARVTAPGGTVAAAVWDYGGRMDLIRHYWDAAAELGLLGEARHQGERFPICQPGALAEAFRAAGLAQVQDGALELEMRFADFDDYWQPFLGGQGPAPAHAVALDPAARERLRQRLQQRLAPASGGPIVLGARAWVARGRRDAP
jgi:SAM-dependent methyltransferase